MKRTFLNCIYAAAFTIVSIGTANSQELKSKVLGKGSPTILIPGLACKGEVWETTAETLANDYECHMLTLPGFAGNLPFEELEKGFLRQSIDLIIKYLDKNKLEKVTLVGHSLGGSIALQIAADYPEAVEKLIIVDAFPFFPAIRNPEISMEDAKTQAASYSEGLLANALKPDEEKAQKERDLLKWMIKSPENIEIVTQWYMDSDPESMAKAMYDLNVTDLRNRVSEITAPTLVLGSWIAGKAYGGTIRNFSTLP